MHGEIAFSHGQSFLTFAKLSEVVQRSVPQQKNPSALISPSYDTKKFQTSPKKCYPS